jgi:hypothetical protein
MLIYFVSKRNPVSLTNINYIFEIAGLSLSILFNGIYIILEV